MKALLVSPNSETRELMGLAVAGISRTLGRPLEFLEAADGDRALRVARREAPDWADEVRRAYSIADQAPTPKPLIIEDSGR